jgi:hypothetical protein
MRRVHVSNIIWDLDEEDEEVDLPTELDIDVDDSLDLTNDLANVISDEYGFTIHGCDYQVATPQ